MMRRALAPLLLLALAAPAAAQLPFARLTAAARSAQGDTLVVTLQLRGTPAVHVSEPFHLADRVRLFVDIDQAASEPDSAALAHLAGDNLLALVPRPRAGGVALVVDVRQLADYRVVQTDSTLSLRLLAVQPPPVLAAAPVSEPVTPVPPVVSKRRPLPDNPLLLLAAAPAALLLLALRRRRSPAPRREAPRAAPEPRPATNPRTATNPAAPTSPEPPRADGRVWAARTLAASGASTADVVRRTGLAREAIRFLHDDAPADSAARGTSGRQQPPAAAVTYARPTR